MSSEKVFKTLEQQIEILKSKGLIIDDEEKAKQILLKENYFFLSGYRHLFMRTQKDNRFLLGTTFEELYSVFVFDRRIRNIFFKNILMIENNIKSLLSYTLSKKYGFKEKDYLNESNFTQDTMKSRQVHDVLNKVKRQIRVNSKQHTATLHYLSNYGYIPLWILVKVLSFGIVSELFLILKHEDQVELSKFYDIEIETLGLYLPILSNYRNLCAHEDILYDHRTQRSIPDTVFHYKLDIEQVENEYIYGKNDLYSVVIIFKQMLTKDEFREFMNELSYEIYALTTKTKVLPINKLLNKIGFPDNWRDIIEIKK